MPNNRVHVRAARILLGVPHPEVDATMDAASHYLYGAHHLVMHDGDTVHVMERQFGGGLAAALHIAMDMRLVTQDDVRHWEKILKGFGK